MGEAEFSRILTDWRIEPEHEHEPVNGHTNEQILLVYVLVLVLVPVCVPVAVLVYVPGLVLGLGLDPSPRVYDATLHVTASRYVTPT